MTFRAVSLLSAVALAGLATVAEAQPPKSVPAAPATAAADKAPVDTTIDVMAMGSTLEFTPAEISVKAGKRVRLRFMNHGSLPHNLVIAKAEDDIDALIAASGMAYKTGYVPVELKDKMIGWTTLASPNQTVEFDFVAPPPGEYTYICLISGHYNSMLGTLRTRK